MVSNMQNMDGDEFWSFINGEELIRDPKSEENKEGNNEKENVEKVINVAQPAKDDANKEKPRPQGSLEENVAREKHIESVFRNLNSFDVSDPSDEDPLFCNEDVDESDGATEWPPKEFDMSSNNTDTLQRALNENEEEPAKEEDDSQLINNPLISFGRMFWNVLDSTGITIILIALAITAKLGHKLLPLVA